MKFLILLILVACSHRPPLSERNDDLVRVSTVMDQVQFSYMKGCVDAYKDLKLGPSFPDCKEKAKAHRMEIKSIIDQPAD